MATTICPDCNKEVSDRANTCIHCGAPLNFSVKNGSIKIKCNYLRGAIVKAHVTDIATGNVLAKISEGQVVSFDITKDTNVEVSYFMTTSAKGLLKFSGSHCYEIKIAPGILMPKLLFNEVTNIDSD